MDKRENNEERMDENASNIYTTQELMTLHLLALGR